MEHPENFDLVNWILNQGYIGATSPGGYGVYTYGDVQRAIWALLDDQNSTSGLGSWNAQRVTEILNAAYASGEGLTPGCNDKVAIIFDPRTSGGTQQQVIIGQTIIASLGIACTQRNETAWGTGLPFSEASWAQYFNYDVE